MLGFPAAMGRLKMVFVSDDPVGMILRCQRQNFFMTFDLRHQVKVIFMDW
jgi:hypothetical protein